MWRTLEDDPGPWDTPGPIQLFHPNWAWPKWFPSWGQRDTRLKLDQVVWRAAQPQPSTNMEEALVRATSQSPLAAIPEDPTNGLTIPPAPPINELFDSEPENPIET